MRKIHVLYDAGCGFCLSSARWLSKQPAFLEIELIPAADVGLARRFPGFSPEPNPSDLIVVSDEGGVYRAERAWLVCLYALREYRELSLVLAKPTLRPFARTAFHLLSRGRRVVPARLPREPAPVCVAEDPILAWRGAKREAEKL